jgi:3-oxoacyl-[acyl-carrier-protein] synthase-3
MPISFQSCDPSTREDIPPVLTLERADFAPAAADAGVSSTYFEIAGVGVALPKTRLSNAELGAELGVTGDWIERRCGVDNRFIAHGETTGSLAIAAARDAIAGTGTTPGFLICATFTPDYPLCPTAPAVANALGLQGIPAFDLNAACAGGIVALLLAIDLLAAKTAESVLIVCSDTTTKFLRETDRSTRILFSDGAAALTLRAAPEGVGATVLARMQGSDGSGSSLFRVASGGSADPRGDSKDVEMDGPALFRFAVGAGCDLISDLIRRAGVRASQISRVYVHQANRRILDALCERTEIPVDRWMFNVSEVGNLAAASVPFLFATHVLGSGRPEPGEVVLLATFGAGLTWAGVVLQF